MTGLYKTVLDLLEWFDPNTGKSIEISKDGSMDKTLLYLLKLTLTLW